MTREAVDLGLGATRVGGSACIPHSLECGITAVRGVEQLQPRSVQVALLCRADLGSMSFARGCTDAGTNVKRFRHAAHIGNVL